MGSRRRFIVSVLAAWLPWSRVAGPRKSRAEAADAPFRETLDAVVDTIVPRDTAPGAVDVGIPKAILRRLADEPDGERLYRDGLSLVEAMARESARSSFRSLDAAARERILLSLDRAGADEVGRRFFRRVRHDVLSMYWASAEGHKAIGYRAPVSGYPEYADPPARSGTRLR